MSLSTNKHILQGQISAREQQTLKFIEFGSQYHLKLNQYRVLNPLHGQNFDNQMIEQNNRLMAQLEGYTFSDNNMSKLKTSSLRNQNNNFKKQSSQTKMSKNQPIQQQVLKQSKQKYIPTKKVSHASTTANSKLFQKSNQSSINNNESILKTVSKQKYISLKSSKSNSKRKQSPFKPFSTATIINSNKLILQQQIHQNEQQAIKMMEFATQYLIKQAEYKFLNPFHAQNSDIVQINKQNQLMNQLNCYSYKRKQPLLNTRSKIKKYQKQNKRFVNREENKDQHQLTDLQLIQRVQLVEFQQKQQEPKQIPHVEFKRVSSSQRSERKSEIIQPPNQVKQKQLSKQINPKQLVKKDQSTFFGIDFNFKKNKKVEEQRKQVINPPHIKNDLKQKDQQPNLNDDSFDKFQFAKSQTNQQNNQSQITNTKQADVVTYRSSGGVGFKVDQQMKIVSEHFSQQQQSIIIDRNILDLDEKSDILSFLKGNAYQSSPPQNKKQSRFMKKPVEKQPSVQQISKYLMKLESFEIQQQILIKKTQKIWNKQFSCIKKLRQTTWNDLKLPRPAYKANNRVSVQDTLLVEDVIQKLIKILRCFNKQPVVKKS